MFCLLIFDFRTLLLSFFSSGVINHMGGLALLSRALFILTFCPDHEKERKDSEYNGFLLCLSQYTISTSCHVCIYCLWGIYQVDLYLLHHK